MSLASPPRARLAPRLGAALALMAAAACSSSGRKSSKAEPAPSEAGKVQKPAANPGDAAMPEDAKQGDAAPALEVKAELPKAAPLGRPLTVRVTVTNAGDRPLVVHTRLAVGYRDSLSRELFVTWKAENEDGEPKLKTRDYERRFAGTDQYEALEPGETIETSFDLWDWTKPARPGTYMLQFHYQADEETPNRPDGVVGGTFSSPPYTLRVTR